MFHVYTLLLGLLGTFRVILNAKTVLFLIYQVYGKMFFDSFMLFPSFIVIYSFDFEKDDSDINYT